MHLIKYMFGTRLARGGWSTGIGLVLILGCAGSSDLGNNFNPVVLLGGLLMMLFGLRLITLAEADEKRRAAHDRRMAAIPPTTHDNLRQFDDDLQWAVDQHSKFK